MGEKPEMEDPSAGGFRHGVGSVEISEAALPLAEHHRDHLPRLRYESCLDGGSAAGFFQGLFHASHVLERAVIGAVCLV